jgi:hypothetical protein
MDIFASQTARQSLGVIAYLARTVYEPSFAEPVADASMISCLADLRTDGAPVCIRLSPRD